MSMSDSQHTHTHKKNKTNQNNRQQSNRQQTADSRKKNNNELNFLTLYHSVTLCLIVYILYTERMVVSVPGDKS